MSIIDFKVGRKTFPAYDFFAFAASFYIGHCNKRGIDTGITVEYLAKYAPTGIAILLTPLMVKKKINKNVRELQSGNKNILFVDGSVKKYEDLNTDEKKEMNLKIKSLESKISRSNYLKKPISEGAKIAVITSLGYSLGYITGGL